MTACYRVTQKQFVPSAFDGEGARLYGGRWNNKGTSIVYTASSLALATLELLVHLESHRILQERYRYIRVEFEDSLCKTLDRSALPRGWDGDPAIAQTKELGDEWIRVGSSVLLAVPSAVIKTETNYLINPKHPDFPKLRMHPAQDFAFDPRLVKT